MNVVDAQIVEARRMADFLIRKEGGIGDKLTWAAHQVERKWGAPASILLRLRNRHDIADMKLSSWLSVVIAATAAGYEAACSTVERQAQHQQELAKDAGADAANSRLYSMAARMGSQKGSPE